ncbi:hypothetical protein EXIGLDRAFT_726742 [Exidia glandulosa HHB12029]|uniref:UBA domain-containing protein n=1 Tax=Exidia glandulosa HHB12029 TaxID=1314781 RepID=A0A165M6T1_EXIGL|nr:hypothetical protein EXIGLDRAFT_726742 [Exidia glandulosa HHB12029]
MSDAFSDLWQTTNPSQSQAKQTLRAAQSQQTPAQPQLPWARQAQASKPDAFSILSSASSTPPLRATTPARSPAPAQRPRNGDAFGDLVSFGGASSRPANSSTLSLAAQQSRPVSSQSMQKPAQLTTSTSAAVWDQLDMLGASRPSNTTSSSASSTDPWDDDFFSAAPTQPKSQPTPAAQSAPTVRQTKPSPSATSNVFDLLGDFGAPAAQPAAVPTTKSHQSPDFTSSLDLPRSNTPGDFDFGDREYKGGNSGDASDDDILGMLAKPVSAVPARASPTPQESAPSRTASRNPYTASPGRVSPPPHVIGQIIEMGFSVEQARVALASTSTGLDVQAALETLLQNGGGDTAEAASSFRDQDSDLEHERERERERTRRLNHERRRRPDAAALESPDPSSDTTATVSAQADKLLNQASEIGLSMLSKANAFWTAGKERAQKAYEERAAASARQSSSSSPAPSKGRPRWMQEAGGDEPSPIDGGRSAFKDDSDDEAPVPRPSRVDAQRPTRREQARPAPAEASTSSARHLVATDESKPAGGYRSPFRGGRQAQPAPSPQPTRRSSPLPPTAPPAPPPPTFPGASQSVLNAVAGHKAKANEAFKLGSYPTAISSYNAAIDLLPAGHMTRVSLLNNRALASIRIGEWKSAIDDCSTAISLIRPAASGNNPPYLGPVPVTGATVDGTNIPGETLHLGDALLKALSRRAAAYEMGEKWPSALADWDAALQAALLPMSAGGGDIGKSRSEATRGSERCKKMVGIVAGGTANGEVSGSNPTPSPPRPVRRPAPKPAAVNAPPSEAVQRLRAANAAANVEEQQKSDLKDSVDSRLQAWKGGKETNIRALIASLDTVLWPELGWQTVGMAELISPKQLKIRYMKAIAKLHPDKLNVDNTTVEQRMIANGVFATLNEAWVASNI